MSDPAALVPVPFFAPVRTDTGTSFRLNQRASHIVPVERRARPAASEVNAGLVYDQSGLWLGAQRLGRIVNIWV